MIDLTENLKDKISKYTAQFIDSNIEKEFCNDEIKHGLKFIKPLLLILGILYFLFIIPDSFLIKNTETHIFIFLNRFIFLILVVIFYWKINKAKSYEFYYKWVTFYELYLALSYIIVVYKYENPDFLIQTFGIILIMLSIFTVPNKWLYMLGTSIIIFIPFFIVSSNTSYSVKINHLMAGIIYSAVALILCSIYSYRINQYRRIQYIYSKELYRLSTTDSMTGTLNRLSFEKMLDEYIEQVTSTDFTFSLIIFDFDDFKKINDQFGHIIGDEVLIRSTAIIKDILGSKYNLFRWGGEEFAIILDNNNIQQAFNIANQILNAMGDSDFNPVRKVSCSFGVTSYEAGDTSRGMQKRADKYLFMAKQAGKNSIVASVDSINFVNNYYDEETLI